MDPNYTALNRKWTLTACLFLVFTVSLLAQSTSNSVKKELTKPIEESANEKSVVKASIKAAFPVAVYEAYQNQAQQKIVDFYAYLTALAQAKDGAEQEEIKKAILLDFALTQLEVLDITATTPKNIPLLDLLNKVRQTSTTFSCTNFKEEGMGETYFNISYDLTTQHNANQTTTRITQKVQFTPKTKSFGTTQKTIWELKLLAF